MDADRAPEPLPIGPVQSEPNSGVAPAPRTQHVCFRLPRPAGSPVSFHPVTGLTVREASATAELLQVFACGEESAAIVFDRLSHIEGSGASDPGGSGCGALQRIAREERAHEDALRAVRCVLPTPIGDPLLRKALLRFYHGLADADPGRHFAAIAALDSAVCVILGHLLRGRASAIRREPWIATVLATIRRDEARHVRVARNFANRLVAPKLADLIAEDTRRGLVAVLAHRADAFAELGVDPDRLFDELRTVPRGLFTLS